MTILSPGGLPGAVDAEWTKLWSVRSTWWSLLAAAALTGLGSLQFALIAVNSNTNADPADDEGVVEAGAMAIKALDLGQFALVALAMLVITAEYSAGTIRTSLQWVPRRGRMLLAKAAVVAAVTFAAGAALGAAGAGVAAPLLGKWGSSSAAGITGDALAMGVYAALVGLFTLGVAAAVRSAVGSLTAVFLILTVVPAILSASDAEFASRVADVLPGVAGRHFMAGDSGPYPAAAGLLLLAGWAVAGLAAGYAVLRRRDA